MYESCLSKKKLKMSSFHQQEVRKKLIELNPSEIILYRACMRNVDFFFFNNNLDKSREYNC